MSFTDIILSIFHIKVRQDAGRKARGIHTIINNEPRFLSLSGFYFPVPATKS